MNRTLCILIWTIITYYTSLNLTAFKLGNFTQVIGLILGSCLTAFFIATFVAKERELLRIGMLTAAICLYLGAVGDPNTYFMFYYNIDKYLLIHQSLCYLLLGTVGACRCILLYGKGYQLKMETIREFFSSMFKPDSVA